MFERRQLPHIMEKRPNSLVGRQINPAVIRTLGHDLARPEYILAEQDGPLWAADTLHCPSEWV